MNFNATMRQSKNKRCPTRDNKKGAGNPSGALLLSMVS